MNPMEELRLQALKTAATAPNAHNSDDVIRIAGEYLNFLLGKSK